MATYKLKLKIDVEMVKQFNTQGWRLCFASGVNSNGSVTYNVVALSRMKFDNATNIIDIKLGQSYTQPADWTTGSVNDDSNAPSAGFRFINKTSGAAAVLYKKINGLNSPIYFSANAPLPPGAEEFTPVNKVAVWFSSTVTTSTLISNFQGKVQEVDFTGRKEVAVEYSGTGAWSVVS